LWACVGLIVTVGAACSGGSGGAPHAASTTTSPPTVAPPTVTPPTVTPPTVPPTVPGGPVVTVPASIDPTGRRDVTNALQQFFGSVPNGRDIRFGKGARYRVEGTLFLKNRAHLTIDGNGATVFATTRGAPDRAQFWIKDGTRIVFRDLEVRGANPNAGTGEKAYVRKLETQHGFRFEGVNGAELDHVQVHDVYGDFVYIGRDKKRVPSRDVWIHDSAFSRNGRQGIAVTAATNVIIERNHIDHTRRATIDLEPNSRSWHVTNVFVLNNIVGTGHLLFVASHGKGPVNDVVISGNRLVGHSLTIDSMGPANARRSNWVVVNNISDVSVHSRPMRFFGIDGLVVRGNKQLVTGNQPGVVLNNVCGADVSGNDFGSGGIRQPTAVCSAPLAIPAIPAIPGRGKSGAIPTVSTVPPTSTSSPTSVAPSSTLPPPSSVPGTSAPGSGGGFDLGDWVFVALGVCVLAAVVLALRARRPRPRADG
jgi:hypothetical protein